MASRRAKLAIASAATAVTLATTALIQPWEGLVTSSHWDRYAKIWDICYGETRVDGKPVRPGMSFPPVECKAMLSRRVMADYYVPLTRCIAGFADKPKSWQAVAISTSYNVGVGAICKSTAAELGRQGRYRESCEAFTRFNRAGGQIVEGLKRRREDGDAQRIGERELCLEGL
ncbi:lysozyme [Bosea sp. TND4EK4]|uniref:lysozyme n=1 Tax=Bosea sp. TND4EK4 TaxID=1907408 RepID=UPI000954A05D|nr:lysozyme [Bosea sp. TND4EK4]SIP95752.1 Phage-related lysozyme (muramidase), GH24 family [Bosea sp. TND4EK4]